MEDRVSLLNANVPRRNYETQESPNPYSNHVEIEKLIEKYNIDGFRHLRLAVILNTIYLVGLVAKWTYFIFYQELVRGGHRLYWETHVILPPIYNYSLLIGHCFWLFTYVMIFIQWTCNVDPKTLEMERGRIKFVDSLILIAMIFGIFCVFIGGFNLNHNDLSNVNLFYDIMYLTQNVGFAMWSTLYFMPLRFLNLKYMLLRLYSFVLIISVLPIDVTYLFWINNYFKITDGLRFVRNYNMENLEHLMKLLKGLSLVSASAEEYTQSITDNYESLYTAQMITMMVALSIAALITLCANFWMRWCAREEHIENDEEAKLYEVFKAKLHVSKAMKYANILLVFVAVVYLGTSFLFFGWFGLYGTNVSFLILCIMIAYTVLSEKIEDREPDSADTRGQSAEIDILEDVDNQISDHYDIINIEELIDKERLKRKQERDLMITKHEIENKRRLQLAKRLVNNDSHYIALSVCVALVVIILQLLFKIVYHTIYYCFTLVTSSILLLLVLFPIKIFVTNMVNVFGSLKSLERNSKFFSAIEPIPPDLPESDENNTEITDPYDNSNETKTDTKNSSKNKFYIPHVTIQVPVYTEDLVEVIEPTVRDVVRAMNYYREHGGTCNLYINDDGLNGVISDYERKQRLKYYKLGNIGYVARPKQNRAGLFKKASNMNYCINFTTKVEKKLEQHKPRGNRYDTYQNPSSSPRAARPQASGIRESEECKDDKLNIGRNGLFVNEPVSSLMQESMQQVLNDVNHECMAGGDIRIGDFILLLDADTRLSERCIYQTVSEFRDKHVAFTQHHTIAMRYDYNYWENSIAFFTNHIYDIGIAQACALGDTAPLVGHNAMLRVKALRETAIESVDRGGAREQWWSEHHVSEDFELTLRLLDKNYYGRYVTYTTYYSTIKKPAADGSSTSSKSTRSMTGLNVASEWNTIAVDGGLTTVTNGLKLDEGEEEEKIIESFMEGVSLTYQDEQTRFRKYAYGCCEIMFNKFSDWPRKGIFSKLFVDFLASNIPFSSKFSILAYMGTYYAMGIGIPISILTCLLVSYVRERKADGHAIGTTLNVLYFIDAKTITPWDIYTQVVVLFSLIVPFAASIWYYRRNKTGISLFRFVLAELRAMLIMYIFWSSILYPIGASILMYFTNAKISWGTTKKSINYSTGYNSIDELKWVLRSNWTQFTFMIVLAVLWIYLHQVFAIEWTKNDVPIFSMIIGHLIGPFLLNPVITSLKY